MGFNFVKDVSAYVVSLLAELFNVLSVLGSNVKKVIHSIFEILELLVNRVRNFLELYLFFPINARFDLLFDDELDLTAFKKDFLNFVLIESLYLIFILRIIRSARLYGAGYFWN